MFQMLQEKRQNSVARKQMELGTGAAGDSRDIQTWTELVVGKGTRNKEGVVQKMVYKGMIAFARKPEGTRKACL